MTHLVDLDPRWITADDGRRIGFTFLCPCCSKDRLTVLNEPTSFRDQIRLMHRAMSTIPEDEHDWPIDWVPTKSTFGWTLSNIDDFTTMTVKPSIDASQSGHWHGFITAGAIT